MREFAGNCRSGYLGATNNAQLCSARILLAGAIINGPGRRQKRAQAQTATSASALGPLPACSASMRRSSREMRSTGSGEGLLQPSR
eukprot:CAMPEP_0115416666 /NCGR_PEP_ID=MMETSP0271-20121206/23731_1 /TAXON_ID=71861 /ORGANISM="Scrippsiella trochoidea, Strain CCMP3099" /LENGTH=85 /DNA_ID=CAMNT_0002841039 /DNA_START=11 /DNA_END=266 /DNA_ORIENTATION=+